MLDPSGTPSPYMPISHSTTYAPILPIPGSQQVRYVLRGFYNVESSHLNRHNLRKLSVSSERTIAGISQSFRFMPAD